jgi:hypothetical protein
MGDAEGPSCVCGAFSYFELCMNCREHIEEQLLVDTILENYVSPIIDSLTIPKYFMWE